MCRTRRVSTAARTRTVAGVLCRTSKSPVGVRIGVGVLGAGRGVAGCSRFFFAHVQVVCMVPVHVHV